MSITVTIQAASDATMTDDGKLDGTELADDDLRIVYGLPNMYVGSDSRIYFATYSSSLGDKPPRWDTVNTPAATVNSVKTVTILAQEYLYGMPDEHEIRYDWVNDAPDIVRYAAHIPPTSTAFQLRCESISHDVDDASAISPLPSMNTNDGAKANSMTPGQLINIVIGMGLRSEVIKLTGVLVDEGTISASNPRKQVLMNIARLQYLKSGRGGSENSWGGTNSGPLNPRSYPCLTKFDPNTVVTPTFDRMDQQPAGLNLSYRGIIKNMSFRQEGGRPNQWFWSMEYQVVANEHAQGNMLSAAGSEGSMEISRIRLVEVNSDLTADPKVYQHLPSVALTAGPPTDFPSAGLIEVQVKSDLLIQTGPNSFEGIANDQAIQIVGSDSVPPINGHWYIYLIDHPNNTFLLRPEYNIGNPESVDWIDTTDSAGRNISIATGIHAGGEPRGRLISGNYVWQGFTNGTSGYAMFTAKTQEGKTNLKKEDVFLPGVMSADDVALDGGQI